MSPRPDVSHERRTQILGAAMTVFTRLGLQDARMDDIAAEAGVGKGTLYLYFESKDDVQFALMREIFAHQLDDLGPILDAPGPLEERLRALTRRLAADVERMAASMPVMWECYALAARQEAVRQYLRGYFRAYRRRLTDFLQSRVGTGELTDAEADTLAVSIIAVFEGTALLWLTDPETIDWENHTAAALELLLAGRRR